MLDPKWKQNIDLIVQRAAEAFDRRMAPVTSANLYNALLPFNGIMHNGDHITQSMAFYEQLALEDFARNREHDLAEAHRIREVYATALDQAGIQGVVAGPGEGA